MRIHLILALVGLAIGLAWPAFAQTEETVDPKITQQIGALIAKFDEMFNKHDAAAVAALFTEDASYDTPHGTFYGWQAIQKHCAGEFQDYHPSDHLSTIDRVNAVGDEVQAFGSWKGTYQESGGGPIQAKGLCSWVLVHAGDTWKIRRDTYGISKRSY